MTAMRNCKNDDLSTAGTFLRDLKKHSLILRLEFSINASNSHFVAIKFKGKGFWERGQCRLKLGYSMF
jgi:hypothetical protein